MLREQNSSVRTFLNKEKFKIPNQIGRNLKAILQSFHKMKQTIKFLKRMEVTYKILSCLPGNSQSDDVVTLKDHKTIDQV